MTETAPRLPDGYRLFAYDTLPSTNDRAKELAHAGEPGGAVVWASQQTAGRGRRGRAWVSPPGNLYLSLLLRPGGSAARGAQLGFVAAVALGEALVPPVGDIAALRYKWPNDLLLDGRKVAGILLESETGTGDLVDFVVVGVGVNIAVAPSGTEFPATSLLTERAAGITPGALLEAFVTRFDEWYRRWRQSGFAPVREAWRERAMGLGEVVRVRLERTTMLGRFIDLDEEGALLLEQAGNRTRVAAGEIFPASS